LGRLPLHHDAIDKAVDLNGQATGMNKRAFALGRLYAVDAEKVRRLAYPTASPATMPPRTLDELTANRAEQLRAYRNEAYARRYLDVVQRVRQAENERAKGFDGLAMSVARQLYSVMAYKDEYEVARLFSSKEFRDQLNDTFEGDYRIEFNLAPPILSRPDRRTGRPGKIRFGPWMMGVFRMLSALRALRGTAFDIFGYSRERRAEKRMIDDYLADVELVIRSLNTGNHKLAMELLEWPETVRGFGDIKLAALEEAHTRRAALRSELESPSSQSHAA
jgi:indolepyruvate ferredoxin oxidoreductase